MLNSSNEINYNELVNPTFATGQATLEMLAAAGNPDAAEYLRLLSISNAVNRVSGNSSAENQLFTPEEGRALMMGVTLGIEARYAAVSRLLLESGCRNMLDIACGYTPRALMCQKAGVDYVGFDLPAVVDKMESVSKEHFTDLAHPAYFAGDVTNPASLKQAADLLDGEIFITCEGLMTYLNQSELEQTILGIREILLAHGGAWYSSDMDIQFDHFSAVAINNPDVLARFAKNVSSIKKETDVYFFPVSFKTMEEKIAFFENLGMHVERIPFYTDETQLNILHGFDAAGQARMKGLMKSFCLWKMTPKEMPLERCASAESDFSIQYQQNEGELRVALQGRLDTLSAPQLMKLLDELYAKQSFVDLVFDLDSLTYMSSTGIRVLLMMAKRVGNGHVCVENASERILNIFEAAGFTDVIAIR